jgi:alkylation response protein AidB-like acyl-CoA dehydrogenase
MGTILPVFERPLRTAALLAAEDEALAVARSIADHFAAPTEEPPQPGIAEALLELVARSGLLGVSIPSEHGGIDVSNTVLAEICAILAEHSPTMGEIVSSHFVATEQLRSHGTEGQRNTLFAAALSGARLARAHALRHGTAEERRIAMTTNGLGWRLGGEALCTPEAQHADWLLVPADSDIGKSFTVLLPTRIAGLRYIANNGEHAAGGTQAGARLLFKDVATDGDVLLHPVADTGRPDVPRALELLLEAALHLGKGRRYFQHILGSAEAETTSPSDARAFAIGTVSVRLAAAEAMIESAGRAIDAAQVGSADQHRVTALLAARAACVTAAEADRTAQALLDGASDAMTGDVEALPLRIASLLRETGRHGLTARDGQIGDL